MLSDMHGTENVRSGAGKRPDRQRRKRGAVNGKGKGNTTAASRGNAGNDSEELAVLWESAEFIISARLRTEDGNPFPRGQFPWLWKVAGMLALTEVDGKTFDRCFAHAFGACMQHSNDASMRQFGGDAMRKFGKVDLAQAFRRAVAENECTRKLLESAKGGKQS